MRIASIFLFLGTFSLPAVENPHLSTTRFVIPERGELTGLVMTTASNSISMLPPHGWKQESRPGQVVFLSPDLSASLTVQIFDHLQLTNNWNWDAVRAEIVERSPTAHIAGEVNWYACDAAGKAFDVEHNGGNGAKLVRRIALVPLSTGVIEVSLTAPRSKVPDLHHVFGPFMSSLRLNRPERN